MRVISRAILRTLVHTHLHRRLLTLILSVTKVSVDVKVGPRQEALDGGEKSRH